MVKGFACKANEHSGVRFSPTALVIANVVHCVFSLARERWVLKPDSYPGHAGIVTRTRYVSDEAMRRSAAHVRRFWTWKDAELVEEDDDFRIVAPGRIVVNGPSVDDFDPSSLPNTGTGTGWCAPSP